MKDQELYAFWSCAHYPYLLGGEISSFHEGGIVKVKDYGGRCFRPQFICLKIEGAQLVQQLGDLKNEYAQKQESLKREFHAHLNNTLSTYACTRNYKGAQHD